MHQESALLPAAQPSSYTCTPIPKDDSSQDRAGILSNYTPFLPVNILCLLSVSLSQAGSLHEDNIKDMLSGAHTGLQSLNL